MDSYFNQDAAGVSVIQRQIKYVGSTASIFPDCADPFLHA